MGGLSKKGCFFDRNSKMLVGFSDLRGFSKLGGFFHRNSKNLGEFSDL